MAHQKGLHKEDIKAEIRKRGKTLHQLSIENGFAPSTVRSALIKPCRRADLVIAKFIERSLHEIWPDRYDANNNALRPSGHPVRQSSAKINVRHCQKCGCKSALPKTEGRT